MYTIKIVRGNIVNVTTEAIVNPANNNLMPGGGANKMIFYAAGDKLIEECSKFKYCETGNAVYTQGFNIPAKYIIHAVGPYWHGGYNNEAQDLASCYISIMKIAEKLGIKSLAIPALCTGRGGYPLDEAVDIAVSSVVSYLQSHNLDMEIWFMCYDQETLLRYRAKNMDGVNDVGQYFNRQTIKISSKLLKSEKKHLKKKLFKKTITKEQEEQALLLVLKRVLKKKYSDVVFLAPPKTKDKISMKTCTKYDSSGPFVTMDCVLNYSYDNEKMKIEVKPYSFVDTPEEIESRKRYFLDDNDENSLSEQFEGGNQSSYNQSQKILKVANIENMLTGISAGNGVNIEYVDVEKTNVKIEDITDAKDELTKVALENTNDQNVSIDENAVISTPQYNTYSEETVSYDYEEDEYSEEIIDSVEEVEQVEQVESVEPDPIVFEEPPVVYEETLVTDDSSTYDTICEEVVSEVPVEVYEEACEEVDNTVNNVEETVEDIILEDHIPNDEIVNTERKEEISYDQTLETHPMDVSIKEVYPTEIIEKVSESFEVSEGRTNEEVFEEIEENVVETIIEDDIFTDFNTEIENDTFENETTDVCESCETVDVVIESSPNPSPNTTQKSTKNSTSPNKNKNKNQYKKSKKDYRPDYSKYKNKNSSNKNSSNKKTNIPKNTKK